MEKISVVMATYNGELYIREQLLSILNQTVIPAEIIICDDCSTDNTVEEIYKILNGANCKYKIIRHETNKGVLMSFFDGLQNTTGNIIFLADQDDYWMEQKIETYMKIFKKYSNVGLIFSDAYITDNNLNLTGKTLWETIDYTHSNLYNNITLMKEVIKRNFFTGMCMAFRKEILPKFLNISINMLHDEYLGWIALCKSEVYGIDIPLVYYRQHKNNVKGALKFNKIENIDNALENIMRSSARYADKFLEMNNYVDNEAEIKKYLENAQDFYLWRKKVIHQKRIKSLLNIFERLVSNEYQKFGSKSDNNFLKDVFLVVYKKRAAGICNQYKII